jgi:hypothetical protein
MTEGGMDGDSELRELIVRRVVDPAVPRGAVSP